MDLKAGPLVLRVAVLLAENCRVPFDDPNTHLELTMIHEVMVLDHSGPDLALILYGASIKLFLFGALFVRLALGVALGGLAGAALFLAGMLMVVLANDALFFLVAWEVMAVSAWLLVIFGCLALLASLGDWKHIEVLPNEQPVAAGEPDLYMEKATITQYGEDGSVSYRLLSSEVRHYEDHAVGVVHEVVEVERAPLRWEVPVDHGRVQVVVEEELGAEGGEVDEHPRPAAALHPDDEGVGRPRLTPGFGTGPDQPARVPCCSGS